MNEEENLDELGEKLYDRIFSKHGEIAGKLTGMMLELPDKVIMQMLQDESVLNDGISRALQALSPDSQVVCEVEEASASSDSLGERLYDLIDLHNTGHTHKITGMLLEQNKEAILQILSDPELLEKKINIALKTLLEQGEERTNMTESSDSEVESESIGEKLFNLVKQIDHTHSADITGMLLEMDSESLNQVLKDRSLLEVAVKRAQSALEAHTHTHSSE
ncbi:hypothetical protein AALO_G00162130 [Alosa alosa]|uniref:PABC domain-containing protein n=1 Tax=Alosa alosa TaxID=278164 RepID=A0AAV6GAR9_9TELE|nr:uncharacterized protein LOC121680093 isoform X2 [Alosa sapidissima]XP_048115704.1 uncharacterized protein LOC125305135 isoform X2 [Alosa alosa]KAG5272143.1 hypothetical protein AALO_G00162130 [Alosa alosa]